MPDSQTKLPRFLLPGDLIAVVSTAFHANEEWQQSGIKLIENAGFRVLLPQQSMKAFGALAGADNERLAGLQVAINNPEVKAIWFARGGYGSSRLLDGLDLTALVQSPKWFIGFSDITVFHQLLQSRGVCSIHAPMVAQLGKDNTGFLATIELLGGKSKSMQWATSLQGKVEAEGILLGGNLSLLAHLCGQKWVENNKSKPPRILFLEEIGEKLYHIDRMLVQLKNAGKFDNVQAVLLGDFSDISNEANFPGELKDIVAHHCGVPVIDGLKAGHCTPNLPLLLGANHQLLAENGQARLNFLQVSQ